MSQSRELIGVRLWGGQAVFSRRLFEPETKDVMGKPLDKPSFSITVRFPKTRQFWWEEPALQTFAQACQVIMTRDLAGVPSNRIEFPIKDGDLPNTKNKISDWARGHWIFRASTTFRESLEVKQQVGGALTDLPALSLGGNRLWGDGDYVMVSAQVGKRLNDNIGIRSYLAGVCFYDKGEVLSTGGVSTDWDEAFRDAAQKGLTIKNGGPQQGFMNPSAGMGQGFGAPAFGAPQQAFGQPPQQSFQQPSPYAAPFGQPQGFQQSPQPPQQGFGAPPQQNFQQPQQFTPQPPQPPQMQPFQPQQPPQQQGWPQPQQHPQWSQYKTGNDDIPF